MIRQDMATPTPKRAHERVRHHRADRQARGRAQGRQQARNQERHRAAGQSRDPGDHRRVIAISKAIENDEDQTIRQYDKVLFDPREAIPVELEHDNRLFVVHIDRVLAIFRRSDAAKPASAAGKEADTEDDDA
jgi:hypothetical protein